MKNHGSVCTFYIVRHGRTQFNVNGIIQGQCDSPLTADGIEVAQAVAKNFKHIQFDHVFSSDLLRALRTAEILATEHQLAVVTTKLLRERHMGRYEGKPIQQYQEELKDLLAHMETLSEKEQFTYKVAEDIESDDEIASRFITFLRETAIAYPGKNILVVSHGAMMRALLVHLGFGTLKQIPPGSVKNLGYFQLKSDGIEFEIGETHNIEFKPLNDIRR